MAHSYTQCLFHCVWSTRGRENAIPAAVQERLWAYLGGIARENGLAALAVGGTRDHVHMLLSLPAMIATAKAVQLIKAASSKWLHETFPDLHAIGWQEGYGAFSIGISQVEDTKRYIARQAEHHVARGFEEEFVAFLRRHGIKYDSRYVFG